MKISLRALYDIEGLFIYFASCVGKKAKEETVNQSSDYGDLSFVDTYRKVG